MVSKEGVIASFRKPASKSTSDKRIDYTRKPKFLSYKVDKDGYFEVLLSVNKQKYYKKVHQIVAEVFLGEKPEGCVVDHINRNRQDNRVENLRWLPLSKNSDGQRGKKLHRVNIVSVMAKYMEASRMLVRIIIFLIQRYAIIQNNIDEQFLLKV